MNDNINTSSAANDKPYPRSCAACGQLCLMPALMAYDAEVKHDGRLHRFHVPCLRIDKCKRCGEVLFTNRSDDDIATALRDSLGLLQPSEIRQRLGEFGLSQETLAERIGVAAETVSRWLNGLTIQTRAMDDSLRVFFAFRQVRESLGSDTPRKGLDLTEADSRDSTTKHLADSRVDRDEHATDN